MMNPARIQPLDQNSRVVLVDILRGWALLSVVLVNYTIFFSFDAVIRIPAGDRLSKILKIVVQVFFQTKGWTLLALLFGYGFSVLITKIKEEGVQPILIFGRRMFWLFLIALVNCCIYYGDVLKDYVMAGIIILIFYQAAARTFLYLALTCFLVFPAFIPWSQHVHFLNPVASPDLDLYQSNYILNVLWFGLKSGLHVVLEFPKLFDWDMVMLTCGFLGVYLQKINFFEKIKSHTVYIKLLFFGALIFTLIMAAFHELDDKNDWGVEKRYRMEMWFLLGQMVFYSVGICWLYLSGRFIALFKSFQRIGRMTLTNYLIQKLVGLLLFSGFGLGLLHKMPYSLHVILGLIVFIVQIYFSRWWLARYSYGPVEWLWRSLTYRQVLANKKRLKIVIA